METFGSRKVESLGEPWGVLVSLTGVLRSIGESLGVFGSLGEPLGSLEKEKFQIDHGQTDRWTDGQTDIH